MLPAPITRQVIAGENLEVDRLEDDDRRQAYRSDRFRVLQTLRSASGLRSVRSCMKPIPGQAPGVSVSTSGVAHLEGVGRCGSPWSCPVCGPMVRRHRAAETDKAIANHLERVQVNDGETSALFITVTLPHSRSDSLGVLLDRLLSSFRAVQQTSSFRRRAAAWNLSGFIKALEVTTGPNGWHPHLHMVWLFDQGMDPTMIEEVRVYLKAAWAARVDSVGGGKVHGVHGVDVRPLFLKSAEDDSSSTSLSDYLVKLDGGWGAAFELVRGDLKRGRHGRYSPAELLRLAVDGGESWAWYKWWEYETATKGRRMLTWSRGLRGRLGLDKELTDEEAAAALEVEGGDQVLRLEVHPRRWAVMLDHGQVGAYLTRCEQAAATARALCSIWHPPPDS